MEIEDNSQTILQQYVDGVMYWAKNRSLYNKCQHMCVTLYKSNIADRYSLSSAPLSCVLSCTELGVCVDSSLSFCVHINNIVVRVKQRANLLLKCFLSKDSSVLTKAFIVYVRPILEYCSYVWSPSTVGNINKLESVQRSFTKSLAGMHSLSYADRLKALGLERLELHADLIMCYKIVHGLVSIPFESFCELSLQQNTHGHSLKLFYFYPDCRVSFPVRVISLWNRLPSSTVLAENTLQFKTSLKAIDLSYGFAWKEVSCNCYY